MINLTNSFEIPDNEIHSLLTPSYIVDIPQLIQSLHNLRLLAPESSIISYSYKTNYLRPLCTCLHDLGVFAEVVSEFELELSQSYGVPYSSVIYNGPCKSQSAICSVLQGGGLVNIDNMDEVMLVSGLAQAGLIPLSSRIGLRLNLSAFHESLNSRFGICGASQLTQSISALHSSGLSVTCIHSHISTRTFDSFSHQLDSLLSCLSSTSGLSSLKYVDIGGGIPSDMSPSLLSQLSLQKFDYSSFSRLLSDFATRVSSSLNNKVSLILEPGTYLASSSVFLLGSVLSLNRQPGSYTYANLDLSKTHFGSLSSPINYSFSHYPSSSSVMPSPTIPGNEREQTILSSFTCIESDFLSPALSLTVTAGDRFLFSEVGSYSFVFKPPFIRPNFFCYSWNGHIFNLEDTF